MATSPRPLEYGDSLRERVSRHLADHDRIELPLDGRRHAAVAILLVDSQVGDDRIDPHAFDDSDMTKIPGFVPGEEAALDGRMVDVAGGASFVLCRRPARMGRHASQWALPGGRLDPGEDCDPPDGIFCDDNCQAIDNCSPDPCNQDNVCSPEVCSADANNQPICTPDPGSAAGNVCSPPAGGTCDGQGNCVACTVNSDCEDNNACTDNACVAGACEFTNNDNNQ